MYERVSVFLGPMYLMYIPIYKHIYTFFIYIFIWHWGGRVIEIMGKDGMFRMHAFTSEQGLNSCDFSKIEI